MGIILRFVTIILIVFNISCFILKDKKLRLVRQDYNGMEINMEGYWWKNLKSDVPRIVVYFFYTNGVALYGRAIQISQLELEEQQYKTQEFSSFLQKDKTGWGLFQINNNKIEFETWEPSNGGPLHSVTRSGKIINNRTFVITSFYNGYDKKTSILNDTFYFKEFSPKPDSTNRFIK